MLRSYKILLITKNIFKKMYIRKSYILMGKLLIFIVLI